MNNKSQFWALKAYKKRRKYDAGFETTNGTIYGGGNSADVYGSILVNVTDKSNITGTIYGGCNNANVGKDGENQNIYVYVSNAIIGQETDTLIVGGEVFGGGNLGTVYGNTIIEIGSENSKIKTVVGKQVYAGGRGKRRGWPLYHHVPWALCAAGEL